MRKYVLRINRHNSFMVQSSRNLFVLIIAILFLCAFPPSKAKPTTPPTFGKSLQSDFPQPPLSVIVPLYIYPKPSDKICDKTCHAWQYLLEAKDAYPNLEVWAIVGPPTNTNACIPGPRQRPCLSEPPPMDTCTCSTLDVDYMDGLELLKAHGIRMLGYVATGHGRVKDCDFRQCIMRRIDTWKKLVIDYANTHGSDEAIIEGIFFDEMDNDDASAVYYTMFSNYARDENHPFKYTVGNPGDMPTQAVADSVTTIAIYEMVGFPRTCFFTGLCDPRHPKPLPATSSKGKFAILPHDTPEPTPDQIHEAGQYVRYIYATDGDGNWNKFPSYLKKLFCLLQAENDGTTECVSLTECPTECVSTITPFTVPTLSEWGMIILALLLLTVGTVFIVQHRAIRAEVTVGCQAQINRMMNQTLFAPSIFGKVLFWVVLGIILGFTIIIWVAGSISAMDIGGTMLCALILTYLIHLLVLTARGSWSNKT